MNRIFVRKRTLFTFLLILLVVPGLCYLMLRYTSTFTLVSTNDLSVAQKLKIQRQSINVEGKRAGKLTRHIWLDICGNILYALRGHRRFPLNPDLESAVKSLTLTTEKRLNNFGERIYGYIHPYTSGSYRFVLSGYDTSELWISSDDDPYNVLLYSYIRQPSYLMANVYAWYKEYNKYSTQLTKSVYLEEGKKYFIDIYHKQGQLPGHLSIRWKGPQMGKFEDIPSSSLSLYNGVGNIGRHITWRRNDIPAGIPSTDLSEHDGLVLSKEKKDRREQTHIMPLLEYTEIQDLLRNCSYSPTYLVNKQIKRYTCYRHIIPTLVFPEDNTRVADFRKAGLGNGNVPRFVVDQVTRIYLQAFNRKHNRRFKYKGILNLEQRVDIKRGDLYLIELEFELTQASDIKRYGANTVRLSQYAYRFLRNQSGLCLPEGMQWNRNSDIYIIVSVYNQGVWIAHFIKQMVQFQRQAKGYSIHVIINDHYSNDVNVTELVVTSELTSYTVIQRKGMFWKTAAIQAAIDTIKDPHSIVLMLDLHLYLPANFVDIIRTHTIEGRMASAPMLLRLHCGYSKNEINGFWEDEGLGILGIYKSDLDRIGGMNTRDYKGKWGGEDVELVDRVVSYGLEVNRIKVPKFYHQYHSRKGMWDKNALPSIL